MEKINKLKFVFNGCLNNILDWEKMLQNKYLKYRVYEITKKSGSSNNEVIDMLSKLELPVKIICQ